MAGAERFRELLLADLALRQGRVSAAEARKMVCRYWGATGDPGDAAKAPETTPASLADLERRVDRLVAEAGGDPARAVLRHGSLDPVVGRSLTASPKHRAAQRGSAEGHASPPVCEVMGGRYVEFIPIGEGSTDQR